MEDGLKRLKKRLYDLQAHGIYQQEIAIWIMNRKQVTGFSQPSISRLRSATQLMPNHLELLDYLDELIRELKEKELFLEDYSRITHTLKDQVKKEILKAGTAPPVVKEPPSPPSRHLTRIPSISLENDFLGRMEELSQLRNKLESTSRLVLMNGLGGIGKTTLATAYIHKYGSCYDHLVWIDRGEDLISSVALNAELAHHLNFPIEKEEELEIRFRQILRKLHALSGNNLFIIDNAQEQVAQKTIYEALPGSPHWKVLLTSRLKLNGFDCFPLQTLSLTDSKTLFKKYFKGDFSDDDLEGLLKGIGFHTLTVELLAKLLDKLNNLVSIPQLVEILEKRQLDDPDLQEKIWARYSGEERGVYFHLMKAFQLAGLSEKEKWILKQFVVLPVERYAVATLAELIQEQPFALNKTLNGLAVKGWLSLFEDKTFSIHRLIRQVVEYQLSPSFYDAEALIEAMIVKTSADLYVNPLTANAPWLKYAAAIERFFNREEHEKLTDLRENIGSIYIELGQYSEALEYGQKVIGFKEKMLSEDRLGLANSYKQLAAMHCGLGQYAEAKQFQEKTIAIEEVVLHKHHPDLADSYGGLAEIYLYLGQFLEAIEFQKKAIAIQEEVLEANHPMLAHSYHNLGCMYRDLWRFTDTLSSEEKAPERTEDELVEAASFQKKAIAIGEAVFEPNHPKLAIFYGAISNTFQHLKLYAQAVEYQNRALTIREAILDKHHPHQAYSYNNAALLYRDLKQYSQALMLQNKAVAILEMAFEPNHPHLCNSYFVLSTIYEASGDYPEALRFLGKAITILETDVKPNHLRLIRAYNLMTNIQRALGQNAEAKEFEVKASIHKQALRGLRQTELINLEKE